MRNIFLTIAVLSSSELALGCLHFDKAYKGEIKEGTKQVFLFHDGTNAHMVVRTDLRATKGTLPKELAWVLPFPSVPTKYEEVGTEVFQELAALVHPPTWGDHAVRGANVKSTAKAAPSKIKVHAEKTVGNYRVQPVQITETGAGEELNRWLTTNGFNAMPEENQKEYLKKGAVFLAFRVKLGQGKAALKPIHIVYQADSLSFPMKFTHDTRTYDLDLYVMTNDPLANAEPFTAAYLSAADATELTPGKADMAKHLKKLIGEKAGWISKFEGRELNTAEKPLKKVKADPLVRPAAAG